MKSGSLRRHGGTSVKSADDDGAAAKLRKQCVVVESLACSVGECSILGTFFPALGVAWQNGARSRPFNVF